MQLGLRSRTYDSIFVEGRFVTAHSGRRVDVTSPRTEEVIGQVPLAPRSTTVSGRAGPRPSGPPRCAGSPTTSIGEATSSPSSG
jgi:hypothetical protein